MNFIALFRRVQSGEEDSLISEYPFLREYFENREKPSFNENLREKAKAYSEVLIELYQQIANEFPKIFEIKEFDSLRKQRYFDALNLAKAVADPARSNYELAQIFSAVRKDLDYLIEKAEKEELLNPETVEKVRLARALGDRFFET